MSAVFGDGVHPQICRLQHDISFLIKTISSRLVRNALELVSNLPCLMQFWEREWFRKIKYHTLISYLFKSNAQNARADSWNRSMLVVIKLRFEGISWAGLIEIFMDIILYTLGMSCDKDFVFGCIIATIFVEILVYSIYYTHFWCVLFQPLFSRKIETTWQRSIRRHRRADVYGCSGLWSDCRGLWKGIVMIFNVFMYTFLTFFP